MINGESKFVTLRNAYLAKLSKREEHTSTLRTKYGIDYKPSWQTPAEEKRQKKLSAAADKAGDAFMDHLENISPRDWRHGVPVSWVCESLTYQDAVRPVGEKLSVVPPLSYGSTEAKV